MNKCRTELQKLRKKQEAYQATIDRFQKKIADVQNQMLKICLEVTEESNRSFRLAEISLQQNIS